MRGFYDKVILFMRNLFSGGLKDNRHLSYGFLTGILRVDKEGIFSGLNNLKVNSILDNQYSGYFGFMPEEVKAIARYYHAEEKYAEICAWYDGIGSGKRKYLTHGLSSTILAMAVNPRPFGGQPETMKSLAKFWRMQEKKSMNVLTLYCRGNLS